VSVKQRQLALAEDQYRYLKDIAGASNSSPNNKYGSQSSCKFVMFLSSTLI